MSKHTPGPWSVAATHNQCEVVDSAHTGIWNLVAKAEKPEDARLIAAAPEMYEALKQLCELPEARWAERWKPALAALAKAEGVSRSERTGREE